jgi:lipopolysaccharide biosynthesis regulator YciM
MVYIRGMFKTNKGEKNMRKVAEIVEEVLAAGKRFAPIETRREQVEDLFAGLNLDKNQTEQLFGQYNRLLSGNSQFASEVQEILSECFSQVGDEVKAAYFELVVPARAKYIECPDKHTREQLKNKLYRVLSVATDKEVDIIVNSERRLWAVFAKYSNK